MYFDTIRQESAAVKIYQKSAKIFIILSYATS